MDGDEIDLADALANGSEQGGGIAKRVRVAGRENAYVQLLRAVGQCLWRKPHEPLTGGGQPGVGAVDGALHFAAHRQGRLDQAKSGSSRVAGHRGYDAEHPERRLAHLSRDSSSSSLRPTISSYQPIRNE